MPHVPADSRAIVLTEIEAMGGAERSVLALSRWLLGRGLPHHVVTYRDHIGLAAHATHPIAVVELRPEMTAVRKIAALRRYFAARPAAPKPLMSGYQPALHATLAGLRGFHCLMHDTPRLFVDERSLSAAGRGKLRLTNTIVGNGLRSGGHTIVTSEFLRDDCGRLFGVEADIARMGGLDQPGAVRERTVGRELRLLSVSRVEANKRIDWMLRALATLRPEQRVPWRLDIVGRGSQTDAMQQLAQDLGLGERIHFHGYVSDDELHRLYADAHLFLMPAVQGYGIPAIEALQRGLPVLLHRESGVSDILRHTPWATVLEGGEESMVPGLRRALDAVLEGAHRGQPLPPLPTEDDWAERVARLCAWF